MLASPRRRRTDSSGTSSGSEVSEEDDDDEVEDEEAEFGEGGQGGFVRDNLQSTNVSQAHQSMLIAQSECPPDSDVAILTAVELHALPQNITVRHLKASAMQVCLIYLQSVMLNYLPGHTVCHF